MSNFQPIQSTIKIWTDFHDIQAKNAFFVFLGWFCPYVRHPHNHIGWATLMAFASCNPTNPRTNLWNFHENFLRIGDFEKWPFLKNGHFGFFFKFFFFFCFILMKISPNLHGRMDGLKFWCFLWFPENSLLCVILRYTV